MVDRDAFAARLADADARRRRSDAFDPEDIGHFKARLITTFGTDVVRMLDIQVEQHGIWGMQRQRLVGWLKHGGRTFILSLADHHTWQLGTPDDLGRYSTCIASTLDLLFPGQTETARQRNGDALIIALDDISTGSFSRNAAWYGEVDTPTGINVELRDELRPNVLLKRLHLAAVPQVGHHITLAEMDGGDVRGIVTGVRHELVEHDPPFCAGLTTCEQTVILLIQRDPVNDTEGEAML